MPKERFLAAAARGIPDRVPAVYFGFGASQCVLKPFGLTWQDIYFDGENIAKVMLKAYDLWGHDNVCAFLSATCGIDALGVNVTIREMEEPHMDYRRTFLKGFEDLEKLEVPDPLKDGSMPERIKAAEMLSEKIGNTVTILGGFGGISTWAFFLRGLRNFISDFSRNPDFQKAYMSFLTDCAIEFCVAQVDVGCDYIISGEECFDVFLFSPEQAWKCNGIYAKRLADAVHEAGAGYILHCCGNTSLSIETMADVGADVLSIDKIDLVDAKSMVRDRVALMGNIKLDTLLLTPMHADIACKEAIRKAAPGGGYLLSSGYIYPPNTPYENVKALVESTRKYGVYKRNRNEQIGIDSLDQG